MANLTEKQIGDNAQRMVERSLISAIRASGLHLSNSSNLYRKNKKLQPLTPLSKSSAHKRMLRDDEHLYGISVHLGRHGFVQNFGVSKTRKMHTARSKKGRIYTRNAHRFDLSKKKFINKAIANSGAVQYIANQISIARGEEVVSIIKGVFR